MQSRPPHPLLNLEVGKLTPGNCREVDRMGSSKAGPLALGRHMSGVGIRAIRESPLHDRRGVGPGAMPAKTPPFPALFLAFCRRR